MSPKEEQEQYRGAERKAGRRFRKRVKVFKGGEMEEKKGNIEIGRRRKSITCLYCQKEKEKVSKKERKESERPKEEVRAEVKLTMTLMTNF